MNNNVAGIAASSAAEAVKCSRCKRALRSAASIAAKIGPRCAAIEAAMEGLKPAQQDKALELLRDRGVIATAHPAVKRTVSSDGTRSYLTTARSCTCPHGLKNMARRIAGEPEKNPCYQRGAVTLALTPRRSLAKAA